jgi:PHD/YefM family antitoxin component YafN of YafNO toxin-antitoxin module
MHFDQIPKSLFKAKALEFLRQVEATGEPVIITDNGRPTIEVRRFRVDQRTPLERLKGSVTTYTSPTEPVGDNDWEALA